MLLSSIINEFKDSFLRTYTKNLLPSHIMALDAMAGCRHDHGPHMLARCPEHECGTQAVPEELRDLAWKHQETVYSLMFQAVQELLKTFTANDKKLGGSPGFTAVLHTHSRTLDYHPHIHGVKCDLPAQPGSSNKRFRSWRATVHFALTI
jgi:hypothetical protein